MSPRSTTPTKTPRNNSGSVPKKSSEKKPETLETLHMLGINLEIALPDDHEISTFATCNLLKLLTSLNEKANGNSNGERNITNFKQDHHSSWVSVDPRANEMVDWLRDFTNILPVEKLNHFKAPLDSRVEALLYSKLRKSCPIQKEHIKRSSGEEDRSSVKAADKLCEAAFEYAAGRSEGSWIEAGLLAVGRTTPDFSRELAQVVRITNTLMVKGPVSLVPAFRRGLTTPKPDCMIGFKIPKDGNGSITSGFLQFPLGTLTSPGSPLDKPGIYINPCSPDDNPISFPWGIYELKKEKITYASERNADLRILQKNSSDAITVKVDTEVERCYIQAAKGAVVCAAMLNQLSKRDLAPPIFAFTSVGPEWGLFICLQTQKQPPQFKLQLIWEGNILWRWDAFQLICIMDRVRKYALEEIRDWIIVHADEKTTSQAFDKECFNRSPQMPRWDSGYDSPGQSKAQIKLEDVGYFPGLRAASDSPLESKHHDRLAQSHSILTIPQPGQDQLGQHPHEPVHMESDPDDGYTVDTDGDADNSFEKPDVPNSSERCTPKLESKYGKGLGSGSPLPKRTGSRAQGLASRQAGQDEVCSKSRQEELGDAHDALEGRPTTAIGTPNSTPSSDDLLHPLIDSAGCTSSSILAANFMATVRVGIRMVFACLLLECIELLGSGFELFASTVLVLFALRPALSVLIQQDPQFCLENTTTAESDTTASHNPIDPIEDYLVFGHDLTYKLPSEQSWELTTPSSVSLKTGLRYGSSAKPPMQTVPSITPISKTPVRRLFEKEISHKMQSGQLYDDMFLSYDVRNQRNSCSPGQAFINQDFRGCYNDERCEAAENFSMPGAFKEDKVCCNSQQSGAEEHQSGTPRTEFVSLYKWPDWNAHTEGATEDEENDSEFGLSVSDLSSSESFGSSEYWSDEDGEDCIDTLSEGGCQCEKSAYDEHRHYIHDPWPGAPLDSVSHVSKKITKLSTCEKIEGPSTLSAKQQKHDNHYGIHKEAQGPTSIPRYCEFTSLHPEPQHQTGCEPAEYFSYETLGEAHMISPRNAKNQANRKPDEVYQPFSNASTSFKRSNEFDQDEDSTKPPPSKYQHGESGTRYQIWNPDAMKTTEFTFEYPRRLDSRPRRAVEHVFAHLHDASDR